MILFSKLKCLQKKSLKNVSDELNKIGIDVTFSAVLSENLNTKSDIEKYIQFAKECGASQVFFRKQHGTLDPTEVEKTYEGYKSSEYSCPVCRTKVQKINGINVAWKASLEEPSKELGTIYELVVNENAEVTKDWEGKLKVDYNNINESYEYVTESFIGSCGGSSSSSTPREVIYHLRSEDGDMTINVRDKKILKSLIKMFSFNKLSKSVYEFNISDVKDILDAIETLKITTKFNI